MWKVSRGNVAAGAIAGTLSGNGYLMVRINSKGYYVHRINFKMHNGYEIDEIDHDDRNRLNNRPSNLKPGNQGQNRKNLPKSARNVSGVTGVSKHQNGWVVRIGRKYHSTHKDFQDAVKARQAAEQQLGYHKNHGR